MYHVLSQVRTQGFWVDPKFGVEPGYVSVDHSLARSLTPGRSTSRQNRAFPVLFAAQSPSERLGQTLPVTTSHSRPGAPSVESGVGGQSVWPVLRGSRSRISTGGVPARWDPSVVSRERQTSFATDSPLAPFSTRDTHVCRPQAPLCFRTSPPRPNRSDRRSTWLTLPVRRGSLPPLPQRRTADCLPRPTRIGGGDGTT